MNNTREFTSVRSAVCGSLRANHFRAPLLAGGLLLLSSCSTPHGGHDPWVYAISREFYPSMCGGRVFVSSASQNQGCEAIAMLAIFALPFAIDTVLLPVTVPHDLIVLK